MSADLPLTNWSRSSRFHPTFLQILQFTDQIENLKPTELTDANHSQSSPAFTAVQRRNDEFTTTPAATPAISTQRDSSRSENQQPASTVAIHREATHILDMTGDELSRHLVGVKDSRLPMTPDRQQHNDRSTQQTENSTTVTDHDNVLHQEPSSTEKSLSPQHYTSTTGSSLMDFQQEANMQTIHLHPHLPPLLD